MTHTRRAFTHPPNSLALAVGLVRALELEPTTVAFFGGIQVSREMLMTVTSKLALVLFFAAQ